MDDAHKFSFNILFYSLNLFYYFLYVFILVCICGFRNLGSKPRRNDLGTDSDGVRKLWLRGGRGCLSESLDVESGIKLLYYCEHELVLNFDCSL